MLILVGVTVTVAINGGLFEKSKEATQKTLIEREKEELTSAIATAYDEATGVIKEDELQKSLNGWIINKNDNGSYNATSPKGNIYNIAIDGTITSTKGVSINKSSLTLELQEGTIVTETLTASLSEITGEITWSNSDNTKATISATTGESITVTAVAAGTTTITVTCENYTATCTVKVKESMAIGSYVEYDVPYTDMYAGIEYTKDTGWRYLGKDDAGNQLIVSTGIPAILHYDLNSNIGNTADNKKDGNSWWATTAEISATTDILYQTTKGYDYYTDSGEPNKYAAYGLRYKFDKIPFTYQESGTSVSTANTGIFRKVGNTTSGTNISLNFKAEGVNVVDVHNLTLAELNRATSKASGTTRADTETSVGFQYLKGTAKDLFYLGHLTEFTQSWGYWLASPSASNRYYVCNVSRESSDVKYYSSLQLRASNSAFARWLR